MSTRTPSIAIAMQKKIVELTEAWDRCKADNARLEAERDALLDAMKLHTDATEYYVSLLREVLEHNTPPLELRERISAMVSPSGCKQEKPRAAVGETENAETKTQDH